MTSIASQTGFVHTGPYSSGATDSSASRPVHDLAISLMQLHILHANRHDLLPSDDLVRINSFATRLAAFLDGASTRDDFFEVLSKLEDAVEALGREPSKACSGTGGPNCLLAGRSVCAGVSDCVAAKVTDPETQALLVQARQHTNGG